MKTQQSGFTLIELVMVIVILGILAATALPKFIDLRSSAAAAAAEGVLGAAQSAAAINFAGTLMSTPGAVTISTAADVVSAMDPTPTECSATTDTNLRCTFSGTDYDMTVTAATTSTPAKVVKSGSW